MNKIKTNTDKGEREKLQERITMTIVSLILINFIIPAYYYSYFNEELEKTVSYSPLDYEEETENISIERAEITGEVIVELRTGFWERFFALVFTTLILSFLLGFFLINFFRARFEESIINSGLRKVKKMTGKRSSALKTNNGIRVGDIKLFGES